MLAGFGNGANGDVTYKLKDYPALRGVSNGDVEEDFRIHCVRREIQKCVEGGGGGSGGGGYKKDDGGF